MTVEKCRLLAQGIVEENQTWFKFPSTDLVPDEHEFFPAAEMAYYKLGLPVKANGIVGPDGTRVIESLADNCKLVYCSPCAPFIILVD